jgi:hypothetical protein
VALDLLASSIDYDEGFRGEIEKGRSAAGEGRMLEHDMTSWLGWTGATAVDGRPLDDRRRGRP